MPGELTRPSAIGVDAADSIYVASDDGRVAKFAPNGTWIEDFRHRFPGSPVTDLTIAHNGLYVACLDPAADKVVHRYDAAHRYVSSFGDSWSAVEAMPPVVERYCNGGAVDVDADGFVYYTQFTPYEIRKFTPEGELLLTIRRENRFMKPPRVERYGDSTAFHPYSSSFCIIALANGMIVNVVSCFPNDTNPRYAKTVIDLFDADGRLLQSLTKERRISIRCRDAAGRLYAFEKREVWQVVRYRLQLP
jgi:hypothetical protein